MLIQAMGSPSLNQLHQCPHDGSKQIDAEEWDYPPCQAIQCAGWDLTQNTDKELINK